MHTRRRLALCCCLSVIGVKALAHHSAAMFDEQHSKALNGTVKVYQWTNPHSWIQLLVRQEGSSAVEWSVQLGSPSQLFRIGWRPDTIKPGDKISVVIHPMRDGTRGGLFVSGIGLDGKPLGSRP
jgi:hypothetical protein